MNQRRMRALLRWTIPGVILLQLTSCLGPNPGFFVGTSAANASIMFLVQRFWGALLGGGA